MYLFIFKFYNLIFMWFWKL